MRATIVLLLLVAYAAADLYMHNPRGSNDRLNEANTNRNNANRLFDSQNNAKGGYCWGPSMTFYTGSQLSVEWTNQHGCGSNPKLSCNLVVQYMCTSRSTATAYTYIRDGETTNTITADATGPTSTGTDGNYLYGLHESYQNYLNCETLNRNMGLFIADRATQGGLDGSRPTAIYSRQNNNGDQYGFECQEERDYYPWWHPSPWVDVAILASNTQYCQFYQANSQNVMQKGYCQPKSGAVTDPTQPSMTADNSPSACQVNGNTWTNAPAWGISPPDCIASPFSRENHLGNGAMTPGFTNSYNWTLPTSSTLLPCLNTDDCNCVLRLRYNISSTEVGYPNMDNPQSGFLDYTYNGEASPVSEDTIISQDGASFQLAIDTTQFGRTFQDRSFVFHISPRPAGISSLNRIFNLNVRGKRGNIVETYPGTEYDYVPTYLYARVGDYIHFQWTGCDTNPAGNAGEGTDQTDRSNIVQITTASATYPATDTWISAHMSQALFPNAGLRLRMSNLDQIGCLNYTALLAKNGGNANNAQADVQNCMKLNAASAYFDGGAIKMNNTGTFYYMNTRSHEFTNRDQKGVLYIQPLLPPWAVGIVVTGSVLFVAAAVVAGMMFYAKSHPHSSVANMFSRM